MNIIKTRLNKELRARLTKLAQERVHDTDTKKVLDKALARATKTMLRLIAQHYPPEEMKVLAKHHCAGPAWRFDFMVIDGGNPPRYGHWQLPNDSEADKAAWPLKPIGSYGTHRLKVEKPADVEVLNAYLSAEAAHDRARQAKLDTFTTLIVNARTLDQIEEVWPAARTVRPYVTNLPAIRLGSLMEQVKAIVDSNQA